MHPDSRSCGNYILVLPPVSNVYYSSSHSYCVCVSCRDANALDVSNCTTEKKTVLFNIASQAFATNTRSQTISLSSYQLTKTYLGTQTDTKHIVTLHDELHVSKADSLFVSFVACRGRKCELRPKFVGLQRQHGHGHLHQSGWERCTGQLCVCLFVCVCVCV